MIVDDYAKRIIFTPPKTGSLNLQAALSQYPQVRLIQGPNPVSFCDHHTICIAPGQIDYEKIVLVRNPLERFISMWRHFFDNDKRMLPFYEFFDEVIRDSPSLYWIYRYTITRWLKWGEQNFFSGSVAKIEYNGFWKLEEVHEHLQEHYPRVVMPPRYPAIVNRPELNDSQITRFKEWAKEDYVQFEYPM